MIDDAEILAKYKHPVTSVITSAILDLNRQVPTFGDPPYIT